MDQKAYLVKLDVLSAIVLKENFLCRYHFIYHFVTTVITQKIHFVDAIYYSNELKQNKEFRLCHVSFSLIDNHFLLLSLHGNYVELPTVSNVIIHADVFPSLMIPRLRDSCHTSQLSNNQLASHF